MKMKVKVYWRIGANKQIKKMLAKGWEPAYVQWDPSGERVMVSWLKKESA